MSHTVVDDFDRFGFTRHELLSTSSAVAPALALVSAPQATFQVTTLDDVVDANDGVLSLREAITLANDTPGLDTITFADSLRGGTILMQQGPFKITDDLIIDGDPLDGGATGIVIDGNKLFFDPNNSFGAFTPFEVKNSYVRFEDLTIRDTYGPDFSVSAIRGDKSDVFVVRSTIADNRGGIGFGIVVSDSQLTVTDSTIARNGGGDLGGGIWLIDSDFQLEKSAILANFGSDVYGIFGSGRVRISESTIADNDLGFDRGAGIRIQGTLDVENSTIARNGSRGGEFGSAIRIDGSLNLVNSTVADTRPGDTLELIRPIIDVSPASTAALTNVTLTDSAAYGGPTVGAAVGLNAGDGATVTIANSIIDHRVVGSIVSNGANTFRDTTVAGATLTDRLGVRAEELFATTEAISGFIRAGVLADNGGPTQTVALLNSPDNPALDAADPADAPALDQRGFFRDATPDIGSFELGPTTLPPLAEGVRVPDAAINGVPRSALTLTAGEDAAISFVDEVAAFQSSLGVYLVGPNGEIVEPRWVFERIEHALPDDSVSPGARPGGGPSTPGDTVLLSDLYDPRELQEGTEFGLFLVADGAVRNPFIVFDGGTLDFRTSGDPAKVTDVVPQLVHTSETGAERMIQGDIMHTVDAGSPNPLSNKLNPPASPGFPVGGRGQALSGLLDGQFVIAFEDKPFSASDKDFNDLLLAVELLDGGDGVPVAAEPAAFSAPAVADLQVLVTEVAET